MSIQYLLNVFIPCLSFLVRYLLNGKLIKNCTVRIFTSWMCLPHHTQIGRSNTIITLRPVWAPLPWRNHLAQLCPLVRLCPVKSLSSVNISPLFFVMACDSSWVLHQEAHSLVRSSWTLVQTSLSSASSLRPCIHGIPVFEFYYFSPSFIDSAEVEILCLQSWDQCHQ